MRTKTYKVWLSMRSRCEYPKNPSYRWYGAKGVKVDARWSVFKNFLADMGECPDGCSIDRIDSNLDYGPENCRWASQKEQQRNRSNNVVYEWDGKKQCLSAWAEDLGIKQRTLWMRLNVYGYSVEEAFTLRPSNLGRNQK